MSIVVTAAETLPRKGTRGIEVTFKDGDLEVIPSSIKYTLTNRPPFGVDATVINLIERVSVTPSTTVVFVLSGDDLDFLASEEGQKYAHRALLVEWVYNSVKLGNNIPDRLQYNFDVEDTAYKG